MKKICLTRNKVAFVDDEDYKEINKFKWTYHRNWATDYAIRSASIGNGTRGTILMHRAILKPPSGMEVDHINGNGLDNRRANLRICTHAQNGCNRRKQANTSSQYLGVRRRDGKWIAQIHILVGSPAKRKIIHLGSFEKEEDAARAYDTAAIGFFREFANLNFKEEPPCKS